jgi:hypothetical protein
MGDVELFNYELSLLQEFLQEALLFNILYSLALLAMRLQEALFFPFSLL